MTAKEPLLPDVIYWSGGKTQAGNYICHEYDPDVDFQNGVKYTRSAPSTGDKAALDAVEKALQYYAERFKNARGSQIQAHIGLAALDKHRAALTDRADDIRELVDALIHETNFMISRRLTPHKTTMELIAKHSQKEGA